jgi:hypothetical protein
MHMLRSLAVCGIVVMLVLVGGGSAAAHSGAPLKTVAVRIGPYPLLVHYYSEPRGGQALVLGIEPDSGAIAPSSYRITAIPGATTNATAVDGRVVPGVDHGGIDGQVNLPVSGQWLLEIQVEGPLGTSYGETPLLASAPPALPEWIGWIFGLTPAALISWFIRWQVRRDRRPATLVGAAAQN